MNSRTFYLLLISVSFHAIANAQLFKCKDADGRYIFQGVPCATGTTDANPRPKPVAAEASVVLPQKNNKPGANWELGPRPVIPSRPAPIVTQVQPTLTPPQVTQEQQQRKQSDFERQQVEQNEKTAAFNRMQRCNYARQQLGVSKTERPIYSYDNKGDRQYVKDENRQAIITAAERRVAEECN